ASGSAVRGFAKLAGETTLPAITIGPRTTAVARDAGFNVVAEAPGPSVLQLAATITRAIPTLTAPRPQRPRRLRANPAMRALIRETRIDPSQLIAPLFVIDGREQQHEIASL